VTVTIAETLGAKIGLAEHIGERQMLLLLDNFEQVVEAAAALSTLLRKCPNLTLLVTSRDLLRLQGEVDYAVPPLADAEAVRLFCERAQIEPSEAIVSLCRRLDNLPLAVELAAARVKVLTPAQILERLPQRLDLLTGGRDADPRQQTLRATIEWSYNLLGRREQRLFRRFAVFAGGCTIEAAEEVCNADVDTLQSLVEKSLLRFSNARYLMLETIREYAAERLVGSDEFEALKRRHVEFVLKLASTLEANLGSDEERERFQLERDNFRAAIAWAKKVNDTEAQLDLVGRTWPFWWHRGHLSEGLRWIEAALAGSTGERTERRVQVLVAGAMFTHRLRHLEAMRRYAEESLDIARALNDRRSTRWPLNLHGMLAAELGDYDSAAARFEEAVAVAREAGDLALVPIVTNNLGYVALLRGDFVRAVEMFEDALAFSRELRNSDDVAFEIFNLALSLYHLRRYEEAVIAAKEAMALAHETENLLSLPDAFTLLGALAGRQGTPDIGARLVGAGELVRDRVGDDLAGAERDLVETTAAELVSMLGERQYADAIAEGQAMSLDDAVEYALRSVE
jgi:predicted ATPase